MRKRIAGIELHQAKGGEDGEEGADKRRQPCIKQALHPRPIYQSVHVNFFVRSLPVRLLQRLSVVMPPRALPPAPLLLLKALIAVVAAVAAGAAQPRSVLLVPRAQWLAAKHEVLVLDDDGLDPRLGVEVELAGCRVHGLQVGEQVVGIW